LSRKGMHTRHCISVCFLQAEFKGGTISGYALSYGGGDRTKHPI
jgi:hypothetical protein